MKMPRVTILVDFLLAIVIIMSIFIFVITKYNVTTRKKDLLLEVSNTSKYISLALTDIAKDAILYNNSEEFGRNIKSLITNGENFIYQIDLKKISNDNIIEIIYSTNDAQTGNILEIPNIKSKLLQNPVVEGENVYKEGEMNIHTYDYISVLTSESEPIGTMNIIFRLDRIDEGSKKSFINNIAIAIGALISMIVFTTVMLLARIYNPITKLIHEVRKIKEGEIAHEVTININNELKILADEINEMKASIWENNLNDRLSNPITGLPGLIHAIEKINENIENDEFFAIISIGVNNTEPYVLQYGMASGDDILRLVVQAVEEVMNEFKIEEYSFFHVRETKFYLIINPENAKEIVAKIAAKFDEQVINLYKNKPQDKNIKIKSIDGKENIYAMLGVNVIGVSNQIRGEIKNYKHAEDKILEVEKSYYNSKGGSVAVMVEHMGEFQKVGEAEKDAAEEKIEISQNTELEDDLLSGLEDL